MNTDKSLEYRVRKLMDMYPKLDHLQAQTILMTTSTELDEILAEKPIERPPPEAVILKNVSVE